MYFRYNILQALSDTPQNKYSCIQIFAIFFSIDSLFRSSVTKYIRSEIRLRHFTHNVNYIFINCISEYALKLSNTCKPDCPATMCLACDHGPSL